MRSLLCLLLLPAAVLAQSVGDTAQNVEQALGKPQLRRNTANGQVWLYRDGTMVKFENGVVREVSGRPSASVASTSPAAAGAPTTKAAAGAATPKPAALHQSILAGCQNALIRAGGVGASAQPLQQKRLLFIYFSAHWCPPCRAFTPRLVEFYNANFKSGDFDLLFVSRDKDQDAMNGYMNDTKMPWYGIRLGNATIDSLYEKFGVSGIPCLVLLNEKDEVLASSYDGATYLGPQAALEKYAALHRK